nr:glycosyltransferase [Nocardioides ochotonae]
MVVAVITYRRPELLARTLESVRGAIDAAGPDHAIRIVAVDNDPDGSALTVCSAVPGVTYVHEPVPGIPSARNAALEAIASHEGLVFIDDDEAATEAWLRELIRTAENYNADAVFGPVVPLLPADTPAWIQRGGFYDRVPHRTGDIPRHPATNNVLLTPGALDRYRNERFDDRFAETGGSDTDYFSRLKAAGAVFTWSAEAIVVETIPPERANLRWLWNRNVRLGNMTTVMRYGDSARLRAMAIGVGRVCFSLPATLVAIIATRRLQANTLVHLPRGIGMIKAAFGKSYREYARSSRDRL